MVSAGSWIRPYPHPVLVLKERVFNKESISKGRANDDSERGGHSGADSAGSDQSDRGEESSEDEEGREAMDGTAIKKD